MFQTTNQYLGWKKNMRIQKKLLGLWYIERSLGEHRQLLIVGT